MTAVPDTTGAGGQPGAPGRHGHLWFLPNGTGLHAPPGRLVAEEGTGRLCCHLCGQWFTALGVHVRVHGHTVGTYRQAMGLPRTSALVAARPARRGGRASDPGPDLRQGRSEGWTIIVTAAAGGQGSDWARSLLRQVQAR